MEFVGKLPAMVADRALKLCIAVGAMTLFGIRPKRGGPRWSCLRPAFGRIGGGGGNVLSGYIRCIIEPVAHLRPQSGFKSP